MTSARRKISDMRHSLKTFCLAIVLTLSCFINVELVPGMDAEFLHLKYSTKNPDLCGYVNNKGRVVIPFGKYRHCFTETWSRFAVVYHAKKGLIAIDRKGKVLFKVMNVDNGPDYPSEGLFRIIEGDKIGFANLDGEIVIKPKFTAAQPFHEGLAAFCEDCVLIKEGEHQSWQKGKWGFIDKRGNIIIPAKYDNVFEGFLKGQAKVELNGEKIRIDSNGKVITPESGEKREIKDIFPDYEPKTSPDTATDFMPSIIGEVSKIPPAKVESFNELLRLFNQYSKQAEKNPGTWEDGNMILGARPREYRPSSDELLTAIIGDRLGEIITVESRGTIQKLMEKGELKLNDISYKRFTFIHADVMGSGRFFYVDKIEAIRIDLPASP